MKSYLMVPIAALSGALATMILGMAQGPTVRSHTQIATLTPMQREILSHMSIVYLSDGQGGTAKTIQVSGVNLRIVNGLGATNGNPDNPDHVIPTATFTNGVGNLIVGYNELGNPNGDDRTGSHNLVVGHGNSFSSFGGLVTSRDNSIGGVYASVSGGNENVASGNFSSVTGGQDNEASGFWACVGGGFDNAASGSHAVVSGGNVNSASGWYTAVSGGLGNDATYLYATVSGGRNNTASGSSSVVSGGEDNTASNVSGWVGGGFGNSASGPNASVSGGRLNVASGVTSSVSGGNENTSGGRYSSVSGGANRSVSGQEDWRAGSLWEND